MDQERSGIVDGPVLRVYLKLSPHPPAGWSHMFSQAWQTPDVLVKRHAGIEGAMVWIECSPEREYDLVAVENAVAQANASYKQALQQKAAEERSLAQLKAKTNRQLIEISRNFYPEPEVVVLPQKSPVRKFIASLKSAFSKILRAP